MQKINRKKALKDCVMLAARKNLVVRKCQSKSGYEVEMPNCSFHYVENESSLISFVQGY